VSSQTIDIDHTHPNVLVAVVNLEESDDLYYRYQRADGIDATLTATLSIGYGLSNQDDEPGSVSVMTIDGSFVPLDVEDKAYAYIFTTTAQAGRKGKLHIYTRKRAIQTP